MSAIAILMPKLTAAVPFFTPWAEHFTRYNSILTTISSIFLFVAFLKWEIRGKIAQKLVTIAAPLTLGVYLIHENLYSRPVIWHSIFHLERIPSSFLVLPQTLVVVTLVYLMCATVDFVRSGLFSLWEKRAFFLKAQERFDNFFYQLFEKLACFLENKI